MPLDLFLGYIKDPVYVTALCTTLSEFAGSLGTAAATVTCAMRIDVWTEPEWRYGMCPDTDSGLAEHV
jgi:hypothetical protein